MNPQRPDGSFLRPKPTATFLCLAWISCTPTTTTSEGAPSNDAHVTPVDAEAVNPDAARCDGHTKNDSTTVAAGSTSTLPGNDSGVAAYDCGVGLTEGVEPLEARISGTQATSDSGVMGLPTLPLCGESNELLGPPLYPVEGAPTNVVIVDLDADTNQDVLITTETGVSWRRGRGDGSFEDAVLFSAPGAAALAVADLNGDDFLDIVTSTGENLGVFFGSPEGMPPIPTLFRIGMLATKLMLHDLNGDGQLDVSAIGNVSHQLAVVFNQGEGVLGSPQVYTTGMYPRGLAIGDFSADSLPDIAVATFDGEAYDDMVHVFTNNGSGSFLQEPSQSWIPGGLATNMASADLNEDGHQDIVVSDDSTSVVYLAYGLASGGFTDPTVHAVGVGPSGLVIDDVDNDGHLDVLTSNYGSSNDISVLCNDGTGGLRPAQSYPAGPFISGLATGDLDNDGTIDAIVSQYITQSLGIVLNDGHGGFITTKNYATGEGPHDGVAADFNGDGFVDLATALSLGGASVNLNDGEGKLLPPVRLATNGGTSDIATADLDWDGKPDLIIALETGIRVYPNVGNGQWGTPGDYLAEPVAAAATADFDLDGHEDVAIVAANDTAGVLLSQSGGVLSEQQRVAVHSTPTDVVAADFDADGWPDLATTNLLSDDISVLRGNGDGTLTEATHYTVQDDPLRIEAGDFNGDAFVDLVAINRNSGTITVLINAGDGLFTSGVHYPAGLAPIFSASGDFDVDGDLDLIVSSNSDHALSLLENQGDATFKLTSRYGAGAQPFGVVAADFNRDGSTDLATMNITSNNVSILLGCNAGE